MQLKSLMRLIAVGCALSSTAFGQVLQIIGATVTCLTTSEITLRCDTDTWITKRTATTVVLSGPLEVGSTVTVQCKSPDAQRKESPAGAATPTPSG
jgi:hypothetical protein